LLVGFHVAGAVLVFSAVMQLQLELTVPGRDTDPPETERTLAAARP
jgi:hypothetical protein